MKNIVPNDVRTLLEDKNTVKILTSVDGRGIPHATVKNSMVLDGDGNLLYLELIETSVTNSNMVRSIWFGKIVSVLLVSSDGRSVQIKGIPLRCLVTGPLFESHYVKIREELGDVELGAVWLIEPEECRDETFASRFAEESAAHPLILHLDRIAKDSGE
jgi:hypothetical protein